MQEGQEARDLINIWLLEITHVIYHNAFLTYIYYGIINLIFKSNKQPYILGTITRNTN